MKKLILMAISGLCPSSDKIDSRWLEPLIDDKLI